MVHNKLSVIFILIASAIAPVVAPPPPAISVTGQGSQSHLDDLHSSSPSHSSPPSSHPERQIKPLPILSPVARVKAQGSKGKARDLNPVIQPGSPNNLSPHSTAQIGGSSNNPGQASSSYDNSNAQHHDDQIPSNGSGKRKRKGTGSKGRTWTQTPRSKHGYNPSTNDGQILHPSSYEFTTIR